MEDNKIEVPKLQYKRQIKNRTPVTGNSGWASRCDLQSRVLKALKTTFKCQRLMKDQILHAIGMIQRSGLWRKERIYSWTIWSGMNY